MRDARPSVIAGCCLTMMAALVLGVGMPGHMVLRHIVQTLPLWPAAILGLRRSPAAGWFGLPVFLFWTALMAMIWLYLLGISNLLSGKFSTLEIAMTLIVGVASVMGIFAFVPLRSAIAPLRATMIFIGVTIVQFVCLRVSFLPALAHR